MQSFAKQSVLGKGLANQARSGFIRTLWIRTFYI